MTHKGVGLRFPVSEGHGIARRALQRAAWHPPTAKQRFSASESSVYKFDVDIAIVAGHIECFFSAIFMVRQITLALFDF